MSKKPGAIHGASISYDKNYEGMPGEMMLNNGMLLRGEDWNGFLKNYVESFPPNKREVILQGLIRFRVKYDKVEKFIRFDPLAYLSGPYSSHSYISLRGTLKQKRSTVFVEVRYYGEDWIFADNIKIVADDYTWQSPKLNFKRDNYTKVWEWALLDFSDPKIAKIVDKIISSKEAIIRFKGKYYYDLIVTPRMKDDMKYMVAAIKAINENPAPKPASGQKTK